MNEKLSLGRLSVLGLQHVLSMYAGAIVIPIIVGGGIGLSPDKISFLLSVDLFTCGISTIIQSFDIGNFIGIKLLVVMGVLLSQ